MNDDRITTPDKLIEAIASHASEFVKHSRELIISEHSTSYRWLLASLLTLNSGAAFALLGVDEIPLGPRILSGAVFYLGIMSALMIAVFGQNANRKMMGPLNELAEFWIKVQVTCEFDEEEKERIDAKIASVTKSGMKAKLAGYLSAILFSLGLAICAYAVQDSQTKNPVISKTQKPDAVLQKK